MGRKCHITVRSANSFQHTKLINCFYWWRVNEFIGIRDIRNTIPKRIVVAHASWSFFWLEQGEHVKCAHVLLAFINWHNYFQYSFLPIPQWVKARWTEYEKEKKHAMISSDSARDLYVEWAESKMNVASASMFCPWLKVESTVCRSTMDTSVE